MPPNLLILGGTTEASALAQRLAGTGLRATLSLAGRVKAPAAQPIPMRIGGFGGADGLAAYLRDQRVSHVIDATHPFAAQISANAVTACAEAGVPLLAFTRAPWVAQPGDDWRRVPDIAGAVAALAGPRQNVMLAVGRMHLAAFAAQPQHRYLLRLVEAPDAALPLPDATAIIDRGPFSRAGDTALMRDHGVQVVVAKNAGGSGARAKIDAARDLGLPVILIDRPALPARDEVDSLDAVRAWLAGHGIDLGV